MLSTPTLMAGPQAPHQLNPALGNGGGGSSTASVFATHASGTYSIGVFLRDALYESTFTYLLYFLLTASKFDLAGLVVHRVVAEDHVACERQGEPLTVEYSSIGRESNESVWNGDRVEDAGLEVANEHVRRPHAVELAMVESDRSLVESDRAVSS